MMALPIFARCAAVSRLALISVMALSMATPLAAHEHVEHKDSAKAQMKSANKSEKADKEAQMKKEEIMREISYLAQKLLDISGEDSITVTSPAVVKPFIGVCSKILNLGVELTCITPDSQAEKSGLKTGDIVQTINGISMMSKKPGNDDHPYWPVVKGMKTGDELKMNVLRGGQSLNIDLVVGSLTHPGYELNVSR